MAMKRKLTKEEFATLSDAVKSEYKVTANGSYILDLEGDDDAITELRTALTAERAVTASTKTERDTKAARIAEIELELQQAKEMVEAKNNGTQTEVQKLQQTHTAQMAKLKEENTKELATLTGHLNKAYVDDRAENFAISIAKTPALGKMLAREYKDRFKMEIKDNIPTTIIYDSAGLPTTIEKLTEEVYANKDFADMLRPTGGSGGGADHHANAGGNGGAVNLTQQHSVLARSQGLK